MSSECIDTLGLDRLIRRKKRLWGCKLIRVEVRPGGLMEYAYHCSDAIHDFLIPIDLSKTSCYYFLHGRMERIPNPMLEQNGIAIEGDTLKNTFCVTCLTKEKAIVQVY
jgi:hypothetical protein